MASNRGIDEFARVLAGANTNAKLCLTLLTAGKYPRVFIGTMLYVLFQPVLIPVGILCMRPCTKPRNLARGRAGCRDLNAM